MPRRHPLSPLVAANSAKVVGINRIYGFSGNDPIFYLCKLAACSDAAVWPIHSSQRAMADPDQPA